LKTTLGDLYDEYVSYCRGNGVTKPYSKVDLGKKLREVGIEPYKSNDKLKIKVTAKELAQIAKSHNWVHETDEYFDEQSKQEKCELPDPNGLDAGLCDIPCTQLTDGDLIKQLKDKEEEVHDLSEQFEKMRLEFEEYKKRFPGPQAPPAPPAPPAPKQQAKKSIIAFIDESDEESDTESSTLEKLKDNKVVATLTALDA
jgi:hypothetical protein